jgi:stage II sporulation protein E
VKDLMNKASSSFYQKSIWKSKKENTKEKNKIEEKCIPFGDNSGKFLAGLCTKENIILGTAAFLLTKAVLFNFLAPFGLGFFAAILRQRRQNSLLVFFCSYLALFIFFPFKEALISAVAFLALLALDQFKVFQQRHRPFYLGATLVLALLSKLLFYFLSGKNSLILMAAFIDSLLAAFLAYIFELVIPFLTSPEDLVELDSERFLCSILLFVGIISGTAGLKLGLISVQNTLSRYLIIFWALAGLEIGATVGVIVGVIALITNQIGMSMVALYSLSGMLAGLGRDLGKFGLVVGFLTGNLLLSLYLTGEVQPLVFFLESGAACLLFILTPGKILSLTKSMDRAKKEEKKVKPLNFDLEMLTVNKVSRMSQVLKELACTYEQISCERQKIDSNPAGKILDALAERVCSSCSAVKICWEKEFYQTYHALLSLLTGRGGSNNLTVLQMPANLRKRCTRAKELVNSLNNLLELYNLNAYWESRMAENREIVSGQLKGIAQIMDNLVEEMQLDTRRQLELEKEVAKALKNNKITIKQLAISNLDRNELEISITRPSCVGRSECRKIVAPLISHLLNQTLYVYPERCCLKTGGDTCSFKLYPSRPYKVELGVAKVAKENGPVSGDNYSAVELKDGKYVLLLSDGMGCGVKAANQSRAAIALLEQLMGVGFSQELAVRTANSVLVLRSFEESFATLDLFVLDLYSGQAELIKIGSAPSFLKRNNEIKVINLNSLPIGILNNIEFYSIKQQLQDDDLIVMISDGVLDARRDLINKEEWVKQTLQRIDYNDPQQIADYILERAARYSGGRIEDDMTVIVAKVKRRIVF